VITNHFSNEISYLVIQSDYYAFHAPERIVFPPEMREALANLSFVSNNLKNGIVDKLELLNLSDALETKILGWADQIKEAYREIEKKAVGDFPSFSSDLVDLSELLNKNLINEPSAIEKAKRIDMYIRHLRKSEDVARFSTVSKEFPWFRDLIISELVAIRELLMDEYASIEFIARELIKITEILDRTAFDLAKESERFEEKITKMRSDLLGAKERINEIKAKLVSDPNIKIAN
jgi:hypothetical protein